MHDSRLWIWGTLIILFVLFRALRAAFRSMRGTQADGTARLNAAAERILKQKSAQAPAQRPAHVKQTFAKPAAKQPWQAGRNQPRQAAQNQPRSQAAHAPRPVTAAGTPAVIRRGGIFSAGSEPVVQRRR
jgi:hypothetical protein